MDLILYLLTAYKYYLLFPLAIFEGPILSVISGFLGSTGFFDPVAAFIVIVAGDVVGDSFYYVLGRFANAPFPKKIIKWLGLTEERSESIKEYIDANPLKTISLSKIILGVGVTGLFLAGKVKFSYSRFFVLCLGTSFLTCAFYFLLGYFFGEAFEQINRYLNYFASLTIVATLAAGVYFGIRAKLKKKNKPEI